MYGEKLKIIRKKLPATQEEMAKLLDVSYRTYTSYERDENNPPYSMLVILCKKYKINLNWFVADEGDMFNELSSKIVQIEDEFKLKVETILRNNGLI